MKKITLFTTAMVALAFTLNAQAPKYPLFEHFTQASCGPCASQNPTFQANIMDKNPGVARHIAYHTSWPGVDPMFNFNKAGNNARTSHYSPGGVPMIYLQGNKKSGSPGSFTQADVDAIVNQGSPISISVTQVDNGATRDVNVTVTSAGTPPSGSFTIRTAIIEKEISYSSPPGSNGEKWFPNVFRKMLPADAGEPITLAAQGGSVSFQYTFDEDPAWDMTQIELIAIVQENTSKEIINCGSTEDAAPGNGVMSMPASTMQKATANTKTSFTFNSTNNGSSAEDFKFTLAGSAPNGWTADFDVDGNNYSTQTTLSIAAGASVATKINITPNATVGIGEYTLTMQSVTNPGTTPVTITVSVMSGITDLIISNSAQLGDGDPGDASNWEKVYTDAMDAANNTSYATADNAFAEKAIAANGLDGVKNIYYNVGWTFPSLTDDFVAELTKFMQNGGNLFVSGQDVAWDNYDPNANAHGTAATKAFCDAYLGLNYVADGASTTTQLTAVSGEAIFGTTPSSAIADYYGGGAVYPDEITPKGSGSAAIFNYDGGAKVGAVRNLMGNKIVFIGVGLEQLTKATANAIMKNSHDWFHGLTSTEEFDKNMLSLNMGQNFPNPTNDITTIPFNNLENDVTLELLDVTGRVVFSERVAKGTKLINVNTAQFEAGMYLYRLVNGSVISSGTPMQVVH